MIRRASCHGSVSTALTTGLGDNGGVGGTLLVGFGGRFAPDELDADPRIGAGSTNSGGGGPGGAGGGKLVVCTANAGWSVTVPTCTVAEATCAAPSVLRNSHNSWKAQRPPGTWDDAGGFAQQTTDPVGSAN